MKQKRDQRPSIYIAENIYRIIGPYDKGELSGRINEILDRYGEIIKRADRELEAALIADEIMTVAAVIHGTLWQPAALIDGGIEADMADAETELVKSEENRRALIAKVRGLAYPQQVALIERVRKIMRRGDK